MKTFKYTLPGKVRTLFLDSHIDSVMYDNRIYKKSTFYDMNQLGIMKEEVINDIMEDHTYSELLYSDFVEVITKDKTFDILLDKFMEDIKKLPSNLTKREDDILGQIIIIDSEYRQTMYFKRTDVICAINDNAQEGISNNIRKYLKNKMNNNLFSWKIVDLYNTDLTMVHKFYYYDEKYRYNVSSGAGTLTGWLTAEEIYRRAKDNKIITLNQNYKLSDEFYTRIRS